MSDAPGSTPDTPRPGPSQVRESSPLERRLDALRAVFEDPDLNDPKFPQQLRNSWLRDLATNLELSAEQTLKETKRFIRAGWKPGKEPSYADLGNAEEAAFTDAFLNKFGAVAAFGGTETPVTTRDLSSLVEMGLPEIDDLSFMPNRGSFFYKAGEIEYLVINTKFDDVWLVLGGTAIDDPYGFDKKLAPNLLVKAI